MKNMILPVQVFPPAAGSKDDFTETWFYRIKTVDCRGEAALRSNTNLIRGLENPLSVN